MASTSSNDHTGTLTNLQETTEKRKTSEQFSRNEEQEMKRRKKMFAPRKVIGPRDIIVNSNLPKIKLEEDGFSSVKQENVVVDSSNTDIFSGIDEFIQPWTLNADCEMDAGQSGIYSEIYQNDSSAGITSQPEDNHFARNHVKLLKVLAANKEQEINILNELIKGVQLHLHLNDNLSSNDEIKNEQIGIDDHQINLDSTLAASQILSELAEKFVTFQQLTEEMLTLHNQVFQKYESSLQIQSSEKDKSPGKLVQECFKMVLPILYPELQLNDLLNCRCVCRLWCSATDKFLNTHSSLVPFDKETHLKEKRKLQLERIPTWNVSPIEKLRKAYEFSNLRTLDSFTLNRGFEIVGSTVCLDNLLLEDLTSANLLERFLATFGFCIKYFKIRQNVKLPDFKIGLLMNRVKLCLGQLPKLKTLTIVFCIDADEVDKANGWDSLKRTGNAEYEGWQISDFPRLKKLKSMIIEADITKGWFLNADFLRKFSGSLIKPYSKQLKQLSIFAHGIGPEYLLNVPNLVQLTIPRRFLGHKVEMGCKLVQKCTVTNSTYVLMPKDILNFERLFPNLICLGIKFEYAGGTFNEFDWTSFAPRFKGIVTLELENCGGITFPILCCFPNLRDIRLINRHTDKIEDSDDDTVLNITQLWKGGSLYESKLFWEYFPNISLVTLEFKGDQVRKLDPKLYIWTRNGYDKYWCKRISE